MIRPYSVLLTLTGSALLFFCPGLPLSGQTELQRRPPPAVEYVLGSGDQIALHVTDLDEVPDKPLVIDPSGFVDLPLAGRVQADGLTLAEFKASLVKKFSTYIDSPDISVNLISSSSEPISVIGEVNAPGVHQIAGNRRLLEVISLSGGLKADAGPSVIVTREPRYGGFNSSHARLDPATGYSIVTFSLDDLMASRAPEENILLQPDDVVSIPKAELVYVVGDVHKPGGFQLSTHPTISLLQALSLAEGTAPDNAANRAAILREDHGGDGTRRQIVVDVNKILAGKAPDVQLMADDILFIPHSGAKVATRRLAETALGLTTGLLIYR